MSRDDVLEELRKVNEALSQIEKTLKESKSTGTEYNIIAIFIGFTPIFLYLLTIFQSNEPMSIEYYTTLSLFIFFSATALIWAINKIARADTPFIYSIALVFPIFLVALPFVLSILAVLDLFSFPSPFEQLPFVIIAVYAVVFFAIFSINVLYNRLIERPVQRERTNHNPPE
jgi:hypothetical protein